jgi:hypothetical protein
MHNANKKLKHTKLKNTGLIFEMLIRQISFDVFNNKKNSKARVILEKYFSKGTRLHNEYSLYSAILGSRNRSKPYINSVISECRLKLSSINRNQLNHEKYNLVKEVNEAFGSEFFKSSIPDYKIFASIYKLFTITEDKSLHLKIGQEASIKEVLIESREKDEKPVDVVIKARDVDKKIDDALVFKVLVEKFNKKYSSLSDSQRNILSLYVNSNTTNTEFKGALISEMENLEKIIHIASTNVSDKALQVKVKHVANMVPKLINKINNNIINENIITQVMLYSELLNEISE